MELIKPQVRNEWGNLKEIIVGTTKGAQVPTVGDKCLHNIDYADKSDEWFANRPSAHIHKKLWKRWKKIWKVYVIL